MKMYQNVSFPPFPTSTPRPLGRLVSHPARNEIEFVYNYFVIFYENVDLFCRRTHSWASQSDSFAAQRTYLHVLGRWKIKRLQAVLGECRRLNWHDDGLNRSRERGRTRCVWVGSEWWSADATAAGHHSSHCGSSTTERRLMFVDFMTQLCSLAECLAGRHRKRLHSAYLQNSYILTDTLAVDYCCRSATIFIVDDTISLQYNTDLCLCHL